MGFVTANLALLLTADNVDGVNNAIVSHGADVAKWANQAAGGFPDFTQSTDRWRPMLKSASQERAVSFDGCYDLLTAIGSSSLLNFIHTTRSFEIVLCFRRRGGTVANNRRLAGNSDGQTRGFAVMFGIPGDDGGEGAINVSIGNGSAFISNLSSTKVNAPVGEPMMVVISGDGSGGVSITSDLVSIDTQAFLAAAGVGDAQHEVSIGGANPAPASLYEVADADFYAFAVYTAPNSFENRLQNKAACELLAGVPL